MPPSAQAKRILVVDDSEDVRKIICAFIELHSPFEVCGEAVDGVDAIGKAKHLQPDLIILDLVMPRMNGVEAASIIKRVLPDVAIILLTICSEWMTRPLTSAVGIDVVLSKPDGMKQVLESAESLLRPA